MPLIVGVAVLLLESDCFFERIPYFLTAVPLQMRVNSPSLAMKDTYHILRYKLYYSGKSHDHCILALNLHNLWIVHYHSEPIRIQANANYKGVGWWYKNKKNISQVCEDDKSKPSLIYSYFSYQHSNIQAGSLFQCFVVFCIIINRI